jgi:hypothetical protein
MWDLRHKTQRDAQNSAQAFFAAASYTVCWSGKIAAHSADLRGGLLRCEHCASKKVLLAQLSFGKVLIEVVTCHL